MVCFNWDLFLGTHLNMVSTSLQPFLSLSKSLMAAKAKVTLAGQLLPVKKEEMMHGHSW